MNTKKGYKFDRQDEKIVSLFTDLGMPRNLAKTLTYISQVDECRSSDIEQGANMRQPEVSQAMQELRKRGWVQTREQEKKGKGRPIHIYKAITDISDILKDFEQQKLQEIESLKENIAYLKGLIKKR
jgi:predicted transcriptional regulator